MLIFLAKPTIVSPCSTAISIARLLGAPIETRILIPALLALFTSSNESLPEKIMKLSMNISLDLDSTFPTNLSIALCLPISSPINNKLPFISNKPHA